MKRIGLAVLVTVALAVGIGFRLYQLIGYAQAPPQIVRYQHYSDGPDNGEIVQTYGEVEHPCQLFTHNDNGINTFTCIQDQIHNLQSTVVILD